MDDLNLDDLDFGTEENTPVPERFPKQGSGKLRIKPAHETLPLLMLEGALRGHTRKFFDDSGVCLVIRVPGPDWVAPISKMARKVSTWDQILAYDKPQKSRDIVEDAVRKLSSGGRILCITPVKANTVPMELRSVIDVDVSLDFPDDDTIRKVIHQATGTRVRAVPANIARGLDFSTISTAIRKGSSRKDCIDRLVAAKGAGYVPDPDLASLPELSQLHGYGEAMEWAQRLVSDLEAFREGRLDFSAIERTAILASAPGLGKTTFVRSLAKTARLPLFASSVGAWFANGPGYLDSVIKQIDQLFNGADAVAPAIVFIDECEGIPSRLSLSPRGADWWMPVIGHLLTTLDGAASGPASRLIVIGATNHPTMLDPALVRPGRLSRIIRIEPPDAPALAGIIRQHLGNDIPDADLLPMAELGVGSTGADATEWVKRARSVARQSGREMRPGDLAAQIAPDNGMSEAVLRRVAIHEASHAVVMCAQDAGAVRSVSLVGRAGSGGRTDIEFDDSLITKEQSDALAMFVLAGRCGEEVILGSSSSGSGGGANSDLAKVTELVTVDIVSMGFGEHLAYRASPEQARSLLQLDNRLLAEVERELQRLHAACTDIVEQHRDYIERVAAVLLEDRVLSGERLRAMLAAGSTSRPAPKAVRHG